MEIQVEVLMQIMAEKRLLLYLYGDLAYDQTFSRSIICMKRQCHDYMIVGWFDDTFKFDIKDKLKW